jgi:hypothetical protein
MIKWIDRISEKIKHGIGLSLGEGFEVIRRKKKQNKETREAQNNHQFPTHFTKENIPDQESQQKFLTYALSLIEKEEPRYFYILKLRMLGFSTRALADFLSKRKGWSVTNAQVSKQEALALQYMKAKIDYLRRKGTPLIGEPISV